MFATTIAIFVLVTMYWSCTLAGLSIQIRGTLVDDIDTPLDQARLEAVDVQGHTTQVIDSWVTLLLVGLLYHLFH